VKETPEHLIIEAIRMVLLYFGSLAAVIIAIGTIMKERSVGKTALKAAKEEYEKRIGEIKEDYEDLKNEVEQIKRENITAQKQIQEVSSKYDNLIQRILNKFPFS
jgi:peptidoglycan hydrolase CwlO-like protein